MQYMDETIEKNGIRINKCVLAEDNDKSLTDKIMRRDNDRVVIGGVVLRKRRGESSIEEVIKSIDFNDYSKNFEYDDIKYNRNEVLIKKYCDVYNENSTAKDMKHFINNFLIYEIANYYP